MKKVNNKMNETKQNSKNTQNCRNNAKNCSGKQDPSNCD